MKTVLTSVVVLLVCVATAHGAAIFTAGTYSENFDSIGATGTAPPANWTAGTYNPYRNRQLLDVDPAAVSSRTLLVDDGSSTNKGNCFNYGTTGSSDRAIGHLPTTGGFGDAGLQVEMQNNTGVPITALGIEYTGEQWRDRQATSSSGPEILRVYVSTAANAGYFNLGTNLEFTAPQNTPGSETKLDGNAAANRAVLSDVVNLAGIGYPGGAIAPGANFYLTWHDWNDNATNDHPLAVDDFTVTAIPEPSTLVLAAIGLLVGLGALARRKRS